MRPIQILLAVLLIFAGATYWMRRRSHTADWLILLGVLGTGLLMVAFPDQTSRIAALAGVGRGSDLVLYLGLLGVGYVCLVLYLRQRQIVSDLTEMARVYALEHRRPAAPQAHDATSEGR